MSTCIVYLENYHGQYYPGSTVTGKVICSYSKPINIRGVRVILQGKEHTEWNNKVTYYEKCSETPKYRNVHYTGNNNLLEIVNTLTGEGNYPAGRHEYPFSFNLPRNLPGTFQGKHGWIQYKVKGKVVIPFGFDHQDVKEFKVVSSADLNEIPGLQMVPVSYTAEKNIWWFFRSCGLVTMKVYLDKGGFLQGETAKVKLEVRNMSTENVTKVEVKMGMVIESNVAFPTKETKSDYEVLAVASDTGVGAHGERTYVFDLVVPNSTAVPNFNICRLFSQSAKIDVIAVIKGLHTNMELSAPIHLGTVPIGSQNTFQNAYVQQSSYPAPPYAPRQPAPYPTGVPPYSSYSPPTAQPSTLPRQPPPPYSQFPQPTNLPPHMYPVVPPPTSAPAYTPYSSAPGPSTVPQVSPQKSVFAPSAPKEDIEEDDFVLL